MTTNFEHSISLVFLAPDLNPGLLIFMNPSNRVGVEIFYPYTHLLPYHSLEFKSEAIDFYESIQSCRGRKSFAPTRSCNLIIASGFIGLRFKPGAIGIDEYLYLCRGRKSSTPTRIYYHSIASNSIGIGFKSDAIIS